MLPAARRLCASALPRLGLAAPARGLKELNAESAALIEQAAKVAPAWQGILERVAADAKRMENEPPPPDQWLDTTRAVRYIIQTRGDRRRAFAVGKRKTSVARVYVEPVRDGQLPRIEVNGQLHLEYFPWPMSALSVSPLLLARRSGKYDVQATVRGGGLSGQAQAVRHGVATALQGLEPELRTTLKRADMLTRDPRVVERKKPGKVKARKAPQWVKR